MAANTQNFRVKYGLNVNSEATIGSNLTVNSVATFANSVSVAGNLTVTGAVTFANSIQVGTSELVLLKDVSGSPSSNATLTVNRGTSADVNIRWSETNDIWEFTNDGTLYFPLRSYNDFNYKFSTETNVASDPGTSYIRFNSATLSSVTTIAIDLVELSGATLTDFIDFFDDSNSGFAKGVLLFRSSTNASRYASFNITAVNTATGYRTLTVTHISSSTLFSNDDVILMSFYRVGDKGQKGEVGAQGNVDPTGPTGPTGAKGATGAQGNVGPTGSTGPQGNKGNTGSPGGTGSPGPAGSPGPTGPTNQNLSALGVNTPYGPTGDIRATGEITAYYSDRRLKDNIKVIEDAVAKVKTLTGITYTNNELAAQFGYDTRNRIVGVFADELEAILPEAVKLAPFDTEYVEDENGNRVEKSK